MSDDVLITPASRKIEFKDNSGNIDGKIELDSSGNLKITSPGGGLELGDAASDIYVGNGSANIDIIFEQNGEIRGTTGRTLTLGQSDSNVAVNALNFTSGGNAVITTGNADTPTTTTGYYDADHVLVNDGGVLKKITKDNLNIPIQYGYTFSNYINGGYHINGDPSNQYTSMGLAYRGNAKFTATASLITLNDDTKVVGSLNINNAYTFPTSDGSANQVLQTNGSGTLSFASASGGASNLNGLSDVTITSVQNNDLLKYNSTASRWENTNLGISLDPTLALVHPNSAIYGGGTVLINVTNNVYGNNVYQDPHFFCELRNSSNTIVISNDNITYEYNNNQGRLSFIAPLTAGTYTFKAKVQDFGDLESEFTTLSITVSTIPSMRYWRLKGDGGSNHTYVQEFRLYQNSNLGGTKYPPDLSSSNQGSSETINGVTYIADSSGNYSTTSYHDYKAFDSSSTSSGFWNIGFSNTYSNWFLSIDMGQAISISSALVGINSSYKGGQQGAIIKIQGSSTGNFSGEEITLASFDSFVGMTQTAYNLQFQYG